MFRSSPRSSLRSVLLASICCALLTGCATRNDPGTTGSIGRGEQGAAEQKAQALRNAGRTDEAVKLLQAEVARNPKSKPLLAAYGRALADAGRSDEALAVLANAHDPRRPDWRLLNTEGALLDRLGRTMDAQNRYQAALRLNPDEPAILTNLGLSLALSDKPAEAENVMRRATAHPASTPKMRQNLALVLALQGKYAEAEEIVRRDLPPEEAAANIRYWKESMKTKPAAAPATRRSPAPAAPLKPPAAANDNFGLRS